MGVFDELKGKLGMGGSPSGSAGETALLHSVLEMLGQGGAGGLAGLVKVFQDRGLGEIVGSWVGSGENLPISHDQLLRGLGTEQLQQLAAKAGLPPEVAGSVLAKVLPGMVDQLTPHGQVPEGGVLEQSLRMLKSKLA